MASTIDPSKYDPQDIAAFQESVANWEDHAPDHPVQTLGDPYDTLAQQMLGPDAGMVCDFHDEGGKQVLHYEGKPMPIEINEHGVVMCCGEKLGHFDPSLGCVDEKGAPITPDVMTRRVAFNMQYFLGDRSREQDPQAARTYEQRRADIQRPVLSQNELAPLGTPAKPDLSQLPPIR